MLEFLRKFDNIAFMLRVGSKVKTKLKNKPIVRGTVASIRSVGRTKYFSITLADGTAKEFTIRALEMDDIAPQGQNNQGAVAAGDGNGDLELPEDDNEEDSNEEDEELIDPNDGLVTATVFRPTSTSPRYRCTVCFQCSGLASNSPHSRSYSRSSFRANYPCSCFGYQCSWTIMGEFGACSGGGGGVLMRKRPVSSGLIMV